MSDIPWKEKPVPELEVHIRYRGGGADPSDPRHSFMEYEVRETCFYHDRMTFADGKDLEETEMMMSGTIKWDGCSHNYFGHEADKTEPTGYIHGCSRQDMVRLGAIFDRLFDLATEIMPANEVELR